MNAVEKTEVCEGAGGLFDVGQSDSQNEGSGGILPNLDQGLFERQSPDLVGDVGDAVNQYLKPALCVREVGGGGGRSEGGLR
jgi:hypothetical protein